MSDESVPALAEALRSVLDRRAPSRVLLLGPTACALWHATPGMSAGEVEALAPWPDPCDLLRRLSESARKDFALLGDVPESYGPARAEQLVATLRDGPCPFFCLIADPANPVLGDTQLRALGLTRVPKRGSARDARHLYLYDLARYKRTPEWLNATHWANPELWNKHRW